MYCRLLPSALVSHYIIFTMFWQPQIHMNSNKNNYDMHKLNKLNTAKASYIKHDSPVVKEVVNFADRFLYVLADKDIRFNTI
jgi:hypothetical protein